ncbi:MAG: hypothetical protein ACOY3Y_08045 [Acidobacteriota bacterium]
MTARSEFIVTPQVPVPVQPAPLQPAKTLPAEAAVLSVTGVAGAYAAAHVEPQSIPGGELVTVPAPLPVRVTESW